MLLRVEGGGAEELVAEIKPGQFLNVYLNDAAKLLPRPISIFRADGDTVGIMYKVLGKGTDQLTGYAPGTKVRVLLPLGNGYDLSEVNESTGAIVCGGGIGVPSMLLLAKSLKARGARVTAVLGYHDEPFLLDEMKAVADEVFVATDDGNTGFRGTVTDLMRAEGLKADICYSCGRKVMLRGVRDYSEAAGMKLFVSLEERMGCGYGACVGCAVRLHAQDTDAAGAPRGYVIRKVCKDGPVFDASEVIWDD